MKTISIVKEDSINTEVKVFTEKRMLITHIGNPVEDPLFKGQSFIEVKFINVDGKKAVVHENFIHNGSTYESLVEDGILAEGNVVDLKYEIGTGWIKSINGKSWH